jgi:hypothetical protein
MIHRALSCPLVRAAGSTGAGGIKEAGRRAADSYLRAQGIGRNLGGNMRSWILAAIVVSSPATAQSWGQADCTIVAQFAREAVSPERNPDNAMLRAMEAALDEAISRLDGEHLDAVFDLLPARESGQGELWPNQTTMLLADLLQDRCGIALR